MRVWPSVDETVLAHALAAGRRHPPVDLDDVVWDGADEAREHVLAPRNDSTDIRPARVLGDPAAPRRIVRNPQDNAGRPALHRVIVQLSIDPLQPASCGLATPPSATLTVTDGGCGNPAAEREGVFERFVRLVEARARDTGPSARFQVQIRALSTRGTDCTRAEGT